MEINRKFSDAELLDRACLRVAMVIRRMWEEHGHSHSRLLDSPLIPDRLVIAGRSRAFAGKGRREHVVPCAVIVKECHAMLERGERDAAIAAFIRDHNRIVLVTHEEARRLDAADAVGHRQTMPADWVFDGDLFRRLNLAGIEWAPDASEPAPTDILD